MQQILVRKIFCYDPTFDDTYSRYQGYSKICLREEDPGISKNEEVLVPKKICKIYCSSLTRGKETAKEYTRYTNMDYEVISELNEIMFDLTALLSEEEFEKYGNNLARKRFIDNFIDDKLMESREEIKARIDVLLENAKGLPDGDYVLISHSFLMKILETYLKDPSLFNNPKILRKHFNSSKRTYNFGQGFDFDV